MLDYPRGSSVIKDPCKREAGGGRRAADTEGNVTTEEERRREELEGVILLALKMDPVRATNQRIQEASGS